jgi:hypothetical protein
MNPRPFITNIALSARTMLIALKVEVTLIG